MRIYFLSAAAAALKLNGLYLGVIDKFERHVEINPDDGVFAEAVPEGNAQAVAFFVNFEFLSHPPEYADVYRMGDEALIYIKKYPPKERRFKVIAQTNFCNMLATLYELGTPYLTLESGGRTESISLDGAFSAAVMENQEVGGFPVLLLRGDGCVAAVSERGKLVFLNSAESAECGKTLKICVSFETCARIKAECEFNYDGEKMSLVSGKTVETSPVPPALIHFAFFESVLTRADCAKYLCEELKPKAESLYGFLGEFIGVSVPTESFYAAHGNVKAAGLIYRRGENLYEVKYFAVDEEDGKITNLYEVV